MPLHDWTRVPSGLYHDFHQSWCLYLRNALNAGRLPDGYSALVEQRSGTVEADVLAVNTRPSRPPADAGTATLPRPVTRVVRSSNRQFYAGKASRVSVKHRLGRTVAVIEIVSPGNKDGGPAVREFVDKTVALLRAGIHVLVVDPFPPTPRDPAGLHPLVWEHTEDEEGLDFPPGHDRVLASYLAGPVPMAFDETLGAGDPILDMPLYLRADDLYVTVPLAASYDGAWAVTPEPLRQAVITGVLPGDEDDGAGS
jgi:hypothetical protein